MFFAGAGFFARSRPITLARNRADSSQLPLRAEAPIVPMPPDRPRAARASATLADAVRSWPGPRFPSPRLAQFPHLACDVAQLASALLRRIGEVIDADPGAFQLVADLHKLKVGWLGSRKGRREHHEGGDEEADHPSCSAKGY